MKQTSKAIVSLLSVPLASIEVIGRVRQRDEQESQLPIENAPQVRNEELQSVAQSLTSANEYIARVYGGRARMTWLANPRPSLRGPSTNNS
jgi:hypothetical protein